MEITVFLMPMRIEYLDYFRETSMNFDVIVPELVSLDGVMGFINDMNSLNDALLEIEIQDYDFTVKFLESLRHINKSGRRVLPVDPYSEYSMGIRVKYLAHKLSTELLSDIEKYVAYMEISMADIMRKYALALSKSNFDELVDLTIKYARMDSNRIRFRSELRARAISRLFTERGFTNDDVRIMIHADYFNAIIAHYLSQKLDVDVDVKFAMDGFSEKLGVRLREQPGYVLTMNYVNRKPMDPTEERLLAARTVAYVSLKLRLMDIMRGTNPYMLTLMDNSLIETINSMDYEECKAIFHKNRLRGLFKIRI